VRSRRPRFSIIPVGAACAFALAPGCREELGPERFPTADVQGVIVSAGNPVPSGWIEFQPIDGAVGDFRSARIEPDGTFHADRVAIGRNVIRLVDLPNLSPGAAAALSYSPRIRRTIPADAGAPIRIDVAEELIRHRKAAASESDPRARETRP
jgi:hypothetical protein